MFRTAACLLLAAAAFAEATDAVYFDEELPVADLLKAADDSTRKADWRNALLALQKIVDEHPGSVIAGEPGLWQPASDVVRRRISKMPPEAQGLYEEMFGTAAATLLGTGDAESLRRCSHRYFCTAAGGEATIRLGDAFCDAGAVEMAMKCWEDVAFRHPVGAPRAAMLARLLTVYSRLGLADRAAELVRLHGALRIRVRGTETTLAEHARGLAASPRTAPGPLAIHADLSVTPLPKEMPVPRSVKWRLQILDHKAAPDRPRQPWLGPQEGGRQELQTYPRVAGELVLVNLGPTLAALDLQTGEPRWVRGWWPETIPKLYERIEPAFWFHRFYVASDGVAAYYNQWDRKRCRLMAVDVRRGREIWASEDAGEAAGFDITGPPLIWRDRIYAGAVETEKSADTYLLAFDRGTGRLLWKRFLATFEGTGNPWGGGAGMRPAYAPVVAAGGSWLYVCSNNGALACVSHDGELIWATKYPRTQQSVAWWAMAGNEETWDLNPVLFTGGDVLFFASDGTHCCRVNGLTGKGWRGSAEPLKAMSVVARERGRHLLALDGDIATLTGIECKLYNIETRSGTGIVAIREIPRNATYAGRGFVTENEIIVPLRRGKSELWVFDRAFSAASKKVIPWPLEQPPGTLMLAGRLILSFSPTEIVALCEDPPKEEPPKDAEKPPDPPKDGEGPKEPPKEGPPPEPPAPDPKKDDGAGGEDR